MREIVLVAFLFLVTGCTDGGTELNREDLHAIDELRNAVTNAILAGDAAAYADLCTEEVRLLHHGSPIIEGRAELESHNAAMFDSVSVTSLELTPVEIYGVGDLAYEIGTQELKIEPALPGFASSRKYIHVLRQDPEDNWRFAALMSSDN